MLFERQTFLQTPNNRVPEPCGSPGTFNQLIFHFHINFNFTWNAFFSWTNSLCLNEEIDLVSLEFWALLDPIVTANQQYKYNIKKPKSGYSRKESCQHLAQTQTSPRQRFKLQVWDMLSDTSNQISSTSLPFLSVWFSQSQEQSFSGTFEFKNDFCCV